MTTKGTLYIKMIREASGTILTVQARAECPPDILIHDFFFELRKNRVFNATWRSGEAEERPGLAKIDSGHAAQREQQPSSQAPRVNISVHWPSSPNLPALPALCLPLIAASQSGKGSPAFQNCQLPSKGQRQFRIHSKNNTLIFKGQQRL